MFLMWMFCTCLSSIYKIWQNPKFYKMVKFWGLSSNIWSILPSDSQLALCMFYSLFYSARQSNLWLQPPFLSNQFSKISKVFKSNHYIWNLLSNLRLRPPLHSNQFSKVPKIFKSNHYIWNLLWVTTSCKRSWPLQS